MDARTVNNLPPAATHDGVVRCLIAIELSKRSWIVAVNTPLSDSSVGSNETPGATADRWCCVKKVRKRHAVREMKEDPSEPLCRRRLQTAMSCFGQKPRW
jgi:hypothetical protein